jgi:hypothetical protein
MGQVANVQSAILVLLVMQVFMFLLHSAWIAYSSHKHSQHTRNMRELAQAVIELHLVQKSISGDSSND